MANQITTNINPNTPLQNRTISYVYTLSSMQMQDIIISLYNIVNDHFTVSLSCTGQSSMTYGYYGRASRVNDA